MNLNKKSSVLFVCLGNICRSPTAHGVFQHLVNQAGMADMIAVDSAGTGDWHLGKAPDKRAMAAARSRGYDLSSLRARQVSTADFSRYDYILAMDNQNLADLEQLRPATYVGRLNLFLSFGSRFSELEVPDPYYGGADGFEHVLDLVEDAAAGLLKEIQSSI